MPTDEDDDEIVLRTERLVLRAFRPGDLEALVSMVGNHANLPVWPAPLSRDAATQWLQRSRELYVERGLGLWVVEHAQTGAFVGDCGIVPQQIDDAPMLEVGWHLHLSQWGNGYATEAARAVIQHGFGALGIRRLVALIHPDNAPSERVALRVGMRFDRVVPWRTGPHRLFAIDASTG